MACLWERVCQSRERGAGLFPCIKVKEMCWSVATTIQSSCWSWDEGGGTCV